jgi:hypothetical protein
MQIIISCFYGVYILVTTIAVSSLDHEIFASEGSTVTINCTVNSTEGRIWEYSVFSEKQEV